MKLTFEEQQILKGIRNLNKSHVLKTIKNLNTDSEELKEIKESVLRKIERCTDEEVAEIIMEID
ncbi:hypothetical protein [Clostridium tyrobutyricum]|jgi:hypothetical protein|uniref:hypothetical protein n=1 Tax=Clostridium tyrobutyricum TaxID=1519 RepID=UPI002432B468|nr:hypothetical protein [Clostridium tyrobutyricum]